MSLKCSLLGHRFDETAVERDRQEDGSEVVITITELETCSRCGETRVVSENKEVTTMETPADTAAGDAETTTAGTGAPDASVADATDAGDAIGNDTDDAVADDTDDAPETEGGDAEILGSTDATPGDAGTVSDEAGDVDTAGADAGVDDAPTVDDAVTDTAPTGEPVDSGEEAGADAEIIGGGSDSSGGDDPEADAQARARTDSTTIPDAESGDVPVEEADDEVTDDAVIIDGDTGGERDPGEWPDDPDADESATPAGDTEMGATGGDPSEVTEAVEGDDAAVWTGEGDDPDAGESDESADGDWPENEESSSEPVMGEWPEETTRDDPEEADVDPTLEQSASPTITVPEGMYKCAECGFTTEVESSSLRAGDFCPECHTGTLVQDDAE